MAMHCPIEPILQPVRIRDLRPTQTTVGMREVERKREEWRRRPLNEAGLFLGAHMVPAVIGPGHHYWLIDHHHLALALHLEGVEEVMVSIVANLHGLPKKRFFAFLDSHNWLHPYDAQGERHDWKSLPKRIGHLADDPYRSLAGEVRRSGGYAKSPTPYTEFLWADYFRDTVRPRMVEADFDKAMKRATRLAREPGAKHLPGWAGPDES